MGALGIRAMGSSRGYRIWGLREVWDMYPGIWDYPVSERGSIFWGSPKGEVIT